MKRVIAYFFASIIALWAGLVCADISPTDLGSAIKLGAANVLTLTGATLNVPNTWNLSGGNGAMNLKMNGSTIVTFTASDNGSTFLGKIVSTGSSLGWQVVAAANQACSTTCSTHGACVFGFDTGLGGLDLVDCSSNIADRCLCANNT